MVDQLRPDVAVLDLDIGSGVGQRGIEQIMRRSPTPILVLSPTSFDPRSSPLGALEDGAVDTMPLPARWTAESSEDLRRRVHILRGVYVLRRQRPPPDRAATPVPSSDGGRHPTVAAIAASTGGPAALAQILPGLAGVRAPVLVVQHLQIDFFQDFVRWMGRVTSLPVQAAVDGGRLEPGVVYIGPGGIHLKLGAGLRVVLDPQPLTTHRPSADELFSSIAEHAGAHAIGVVLTGMGEDGAKGLLAMRRRGGVTIAQDEGTSAIFGMPRAAQLAGAASMVLPLDRIAEALVEASRGVPR